MSNQSEIFKPGIELKKIEVQGQNYFFHPETSTVFTLNAEKAGKLEASLRDPQARMPESLQKFITERCIKKNLPDRDTASDVDIDLILTENCNLRCSYCWEHETKSGQSMSSEIALRAVDFLADFARSRAAPRMLVSFFGGEPLLRWKTICQIISYAEARGLESENKILFSLITNGVLLSSKIINYLAQHHCTVTVSLDGPAYIHDAERRSPGGVSSHASAVRALECLLASMPLQSINVEMTIHHQNLPHLEACVEYVRSLGVCNIVLNPIRAFGLTSNSPLAFTPEDYLLFADFLKEKTLQFDNLSSNPYASFVHDHYLDRIVLTERRRTRCDAARSGFSIGVDGSIYPCACFAFKRACALGHVDTGIDTDLLRKFMQDRGTVDDSPECHSCWARYLCGGGCYFQSFSQQKDFRRPWPDDCLYIKTIIESALCAKIELSKRTPANDQDAPRR